MTRRWASAATSGTTSVSRRHQLYRSGRHRRRRQCAAGNYAVSQRNTPTLATCSFGKHGLISIILSKQHQQQEHSESANLRLRGFFYIKWCGIRIRIFVLIRIWMSVGSVPKMSWMHALSASVISPRTVKSAVDYMRNANKCPKIPYSAVVKKINKWSPDHLFIFIWIRINTKKINDF